MNQVQDLNRGATKLFDWDNLSLCTYKEKQDSIVRQFQDQKFKSCIPVELGFQF